MDFSCLKSKPIWVWLEIKELGLRRLTVFGYMYQGATFARVLSQD